jgi:hypothetical protein
MTGLSPSLCGPFDVAQDMLCAFARDIPSFGCGSAALGLCGDINALEYFLRQTYKSGCKKNSGA